MDILTDKRICDESFGINFGKKENMTLDDKLILERAICCFYCYIKNQEESDGLGFSMCFLTS